ncbi:MAG TPA: serine hydrolase domain-containing protein, partial [Cyclobacteriaceae bacterium]|nr:serine hydrolase domain-containing protein [Cyclobacteriaceae bacterium]
NFGKYFLIGLGCIAILFTAFFSFVYFSVDNRVDVKTPVSVFINENPIERLDGVVVPSDSLTAFITNLMQKANVQGLGISIINHHQLIYQRYFGARNKGKNELFSPGTIWYGASLSKTIFADVVMQLVEDGTIHLDTPIYKYLTKPLYLYKTNKLQQFFGANAIDYSNLESDDRYKEITARMCLSHTSGLPNWRWIEPDGKLVIKFDPGTRYSYSGEGMFLLQFVIEELTGKDFEDLAVEKVFIPQKMIRSSYVWQRAYEGNYAVGHDALGNFLGIPKRNVANAAGSLSTTLEEYTSYFQNVLAQKVPRYKILISPQIEIKSKQQFGPNALIEVHDNDSIRLAYGLGFGIYETPFGKAFFKEGHLEGWQHYAVGFPETGLALVMMANSDQAEGIFKELIEHTTSNTYTPWFWEGYIPFDQ